MQEKSKQIEYALPVGAWVRGGSLEYRVESVLGQGSFGITYKVTARISVGQIKSTATFALKEHFVKGRCHRAADGLTVEYPSEAVDDVKESLDSFLKEARRLNSVCKLNRNIVDVNEVFEANNTAYYVMEYLDGGDLRHLVQRNGGGLPEAKALSIIRPVAEAISCIHKEYLLHLDIKPENIVMRRGEDGMPDEPVLIDFGISIHFDSKGHVTTTHNTAGCSNGYSPQEQYGPISEFSPWTDVYALSATLLYLVTGKDPVTAFDVTPQYLQQTIPPEISELTRTAIVNGMKSKLERTQTAKAFLGSLEENRFLTVGYVLRGGKRAYRIVSVEEECGYCYVYKAIIYTGDTPAGAERGGASDTSVVRYTVYEFYDRSMKRSADGQLSGGALTAESAVAGVYAGKMRKLTGLETAGGSNIDGTVLNSEWFTANGTYYAVVRNGWKPAQKTVNINWKKIGLAVGGVAVAGLLIFGLSKIPSMSGGNAPSDTDTTEVVSDTVKNNAGGNADSVKHKSDTGGGEETNVPGGDEPVIQPVDEPQPVVEPKESDDELYRKAVNSGDIQILQSLAKKNYAKAYAPLAKLYVNRSNYSQADKYARLALRSGVGRAEAKNVVEILDLYGYYDNGEHGSKPTD